MSHAEIASRSYRKLGRAGKISGLVTSPIGANFVNLVVVPEPTVTLAALASLSLAGLMLRRRRA